VKIHYTKRFLKQLARIPTLKRAKIESFVFEILPLVRSVTETGNIEKMQGYVDYYKVRFGSYRVGMKLEQDVLILEAVMDRKEIYRFFP
jgi:mRNA interferase RelE/StbE